MTIRQKIEAMLIGVGAFTVLFIIFVLAHEIFRYIYQFFK